MDSRTLDEQSLAEMPKTPRFSPKTIRSVEALVYPDVPVLDVTCPVQVFASANDIVVNAGGTPPYSIRLVAARRTYSRDDRRASRS